MGFLCWTERAGTDYSKLRCGVLSEKETHIGWWIRGNVGSQATERHGPHMYAQPTLRRKYDSKLECFDPKALVNDKKW